MSKVKKTEFRLLSPAHTSFACVLLVNRGLNALHSGFCVGELRPWMVRLDGDRLLRVSASRFCGRGISLWLQRQHIRIGHDDCCVRLGVPLTTVVRFAAYWGGSGVALLVRDSTLATLNILQGSTKQGLAAAADNCVAYDVFVEQLSERFGVL